MNKQLLNGIDHVYLAPKKDEAFSLYELFVKTFKLPVAWKFRDYKKFGSGAAYFGNLSIEVLKLESDFGDYSKTANFGIAFEPSCKTDLLITELEERGINYRKPELFKIGFWKIAKKMWTTTMLSDLLSSQHDQVFFCEYHGIDIQKYQSKFRKKLIEDSGGSLGIIKVSHVFVTLKDYEQKIKLWNQTLSPFELSGTKSYTFYNGPKLTVQQGENDQLKAIAIKVVSKKYSEEFLRKSEIKYEIKNNAIYIDKTITGNVRFILY